MAGGQDILASRSCGLIRAELQLAVSKVRNSRTLLKEEFVLTEPDETLASGAEENASRTGDYARG